MLILKYIYGTGQYSSYRHNKLLQCKFAIKEMANGVTEDITNTKKK